MSSESIILRPRRLKWSLILLVCLGFLAIGIVGAATDGGPGLVFCAVVFGIGSVIAVVQLLPGASFLRLEPAGFTARSLFRDHFVAWHDVAGFGVADVAGRKMVGYDLVPGAAPPPGLAKLNVAIAGCQAALPDTYGLTAEALAALMNERLGEADRLRAREAIDASVPP
ncbi:MAG TPA: hypothetical protein VKS60_15740 [Stellaceae bacterium]|nr:hypothetical protein [Stellaceae bacterium]